MRIGAYDAAAWAGLVFSDRAGRGFALRLAVERGGERAESEDLFFLVHEVGPHAPDGSYARVAFDAGLPFGRGDETPVVRRSEGKAGLSLEWGRLATSVAVMRIRVAYAGILELAGYFPWDWSGRWWAEAGMLRAASADAGCAFALAATMPAQPVAADAVLRWRVEPGFTLCLAAALASSSEDAGRAAREACSEGAVHAALDGAARAYEAERVAVDGAWDGLAASITNNLHWMVLLQPETGRRYAPAGRRWIFPRPQAGRDHWTIFEWDAFFCALELALESPELAREAVEAVLATQYPNGNVPNWRGRFGGTPDRSQPPVGAFAVLKLYCRTGDRTLLERTFPALERWSAWWRADKRGRPRRDGNANGLFEWGCDRELLAGWVPAWEKGVTPRQRSAWESGQDDLPAWDEAGWSEESETLDLESVDLNALLALDDECLARIAAELGDEGKARFYRERCRALRARVNELLWDDERGLYRDRFWDGRRSRRLPASGFYPLLAGIPSLRQAERMVRTLTDESLFWGRFVLPTVSRDDPAFADQQYWRGTVWPPTNYLVYQGLRRYGFDAVAGELASRSVALFLGTFRDYQLCGENYDSRTGEGGGQRHQSWGPLFALMGIEEFADVTPWEGMRVGSLAPPATSTLRRLCLAGHEWTITLSPQGLRVGVDGRDLLESDRPIVLRQLRLTERGVSAKATCLEPLTLATSAESLRLEPGTRRVRLVSR